MLTLGNPTLYIILQAEKTGRLRRRPSGRESSEYTRPGSVISRTGSAKSRTLMSVQHQKIVEQEEEAMSRQTAESVVDTGEEEDTVDGGAARDEADGVSLEEHFYRIDSVQC